MEGDGETHGSARKLSVFLYPYAPCMLYIDLHLPLILKLTVGKYSIHGAFGVCFFVAWWQNW